jgi:hypothetical protein
VLADEFLVLLDGLVHVAEDDALLLPLFLHVLVDDFGLVLRPHAGECVLLGLGNPQFVEGVLDVVGQVRPVVDALARLDVRPDVRDDLVDVDLGEVGLARPVRRHRHLLELFERAKPSLQHPLRLALVFRDDADRLLGQPLLGLEGGSLLLLELEAGFGVGLF